MFREFASARALAFVMAVIGSIAVVAAQKSYPIFTPDDFVKFMKTVGQNFGAVNASIGKADYDSAKSQLTRSREQLAVTVTFWRDRRKDDALKFLKTTLTAMDDLDGALSEEKIDAAKVAAILKQVNGACEACHAAYRDFDPGTKSYTFKPAALR
jgi:cytochrome c556